MTTPVEHPTICPNCNRPGTKHRPWCNTVRTTEPPKQGDTVSHLLIGEAPLLHVYSRREMIEDGDLVDCTQDPFDDLNRQAGVVFDVGLTRAVFDRYVEVPKAHEDSQDIAGRYWDLIWMFVVAARSQPNTDELVFSLICIPNGSGCWSNESRTESSVHRLVELKALAHSGDRGEPCLTVMLPSED